MNSFFEYLINLKLHLKINQVLDTTGTFAGKFTYKDEVNTDFDSIFPILTHSI